MRNLLRTSFLITGLGLYSHANAFDFAISDFKIMRNGMTIFEDTFAGTSPPVAPSFANGKTASYDIPAGAFSAAVSGKLHLNSASATLSPAVSTKLAVTAQLSTSKDPTDLTSGLKPGATLEVAGTWDAVTPAGAGEAYFIEMGDWATLPAPQNKVCECTRLGIVKLSDGKVVIRFWHDSISGDAVQNKTVLDSVVFSPGNNQQILLKLNKASQNSNVVTASYAFISNGQAGTENFLAGSDSLFSSRGYAVAAFKASAPAAYADAQGSNKNLSLTANVNVDNGHVGRTGNIYVAALYQGIVLFNSGTSWLPWSGGAMPPYAANVILGDRSVNVLSNLDVSEVVGAIILVGYGENEQDMLGSSAFETVYTVQ